MSIGFDQFVPPGGYAWWYIDALSSDGRHGLALIAFIGSVFSPYYAAARRGAGDSQPAPDPLHYCALNVALYGEHAKRWALTERGRDSVRRNSSGLQIGRSSLTWERDALTVCIDEVTAPLPSRVRGLVRLHPTALVDRSFALDTDHRHHWHPLAPCAAVEVELHRPGLQWSGSGYLDCNVGHAPLEDAFCSWDWSRGGLRDGSTAVLYDVHERSGARRCLALRFDGIGNTVDFLPPAALRLPRTPVWKVARGTRADHAGGASVMRTLEDTPFYARSLVSARLLNERVTAVHESLSLDRFRARWVQLLLPFRMPRAWW